MRMCGMAKHPRSAATRARSDSGTGRRRKRTLCALMAEASTRGILGGEDDDGVIEWHCADCVARTMADSARMAADSSPPAPTPAPAAPLVVEADAEPAPPSEGQ